MSTQRYISTSFWDDEWVAGLDHIEMLIYLYLLTSPLTHISGIYKIQNRRIAFDAHLPEDTVEKVLEKFEVDKKVYRFKEYIILPTWPKHQKWQQIPKIAKGIINQLDTVSDELFQFLININYRFDFSLCRNRQNIDYDSLSISYTYPSNYSHTNPNTDIDINPDTDTDAETETPVCAEPQSIISQKDYGQQVYDVFHENDLPGSKDIITFLQRDFRLGLDKIRDLQLHSDEVIQACNNYALVINLQKEGKTWWSAHQGFYELCKSNNLLRFMSDRFNINEYTKARSPPHDKSQKITSDDYVPDNLL